MDEINPKDYKRDARGNLVAVAKAERNSHLSSMTTWEFAKSRALHKRPNVGNHSTNRG